MCITMHGLTAKLFFTKSNWTSVDRMRYGSTDDAVDSDLSDEFEYVCVTACLPAPCDGGGDGVAVVALLLTSDFGGVVAG